MVMPYGETESVAGARALKLLWPVRDLGHSAEEQQQQLRDGDYRLKSRMLLLLLLLPD